MMENRERDRLENLSEGENMENRKKSNIGNIEENEQSRRPSGDQGFGSSQGRSSGSSGSSNIDRSGNLDENESSRSDRGSMGRDSNVDRSSEGRH
jgi:hypothetical protein